MKSILGCIRAKDSTERIRGLLLSHVCVGWSNKLTPLGDCILSNQFHSNSDIAGHELLQGWEEGLVLVLGIKTCHRLGIEAGHLQLVDHKSILLDGIDNLAHVSILVWLDHGKGALSVALEVLASMHIAIVSYFQHT